MNERETISIFVRYPAPGAVKPRLISALGQEGAASVQREMTEHVVSVARAFIRRERPMRGIEVRYAGTSETAVQAWLGAGIRYAPQGDGDTGDRMIRTFNNAFESGADAVAVLGVDCPGVSESLLEDAFTALKRADVVMGPSRDGGYYLVGVSKKARFVALPAMFTGIAWGAGYAFGDTLTTVRRLGLSYQIIGRLEEIDHPDDIPIWERILTQAHSRAGVPVITVVVPTLNNSSTIDAILDRLMQGDNIEIIVADSGSTDDTVFRAIARGISIVHAPGTMAAQIEAGISAGTGENIFIAHPDSIPAGRFDDIIRDTLADPLVACGIFTGSAASSHWFGRFLQRIAGFVPSWMLSRNDWSGLFFRTMTLSRAGGVSDLPDNPYAAMIRQFRRLGRVATIRQ
jgi:uncharacterized protein